MKQDYAYPDLLTVAEQIKDKKAFENKTFLITGATGLIGSVLIKSLLFLNDMYGLNTHVVAQIRNIEKAHNIFGGLLDRNDIELLIQDIVDHISYPGKVDFIVHTASPTTSKYFITNPVETILSAFLGTKNILEYCVEKKPIGIVYLSSMEAFGVPNPTLNEITEKDLGYIDLSSTRSSYSEGKRICELLCVSYSDEYGVPVKIARLAQTFGAAVSISEGRVFAQFAKSIINGEDIVLHTEGNSDGNYCYTGDAVNAILTLLVKGVDGEVYTVCNETTNTTIAEMAAMVSKRFGNDKVRVVFDIPEDTKILGYAPTVKMKLSSNKLRNLGWRPTVNLGEMYSRLIDSFKIQMMKY